MRSTGRRAVAIAVGGAGSEPSPGEWRPATSSRVTGRNHHATELDDVGTRVAVRVLDIPQLWLSLLLTGTVPMWKKEPGVTGWSEVRPLATRLRCHGPQGHPCLLNSVSDLQQRPGHSAVHSPSMRPRQGGARCNPR